MPEPAVDLYGIPNCDQVKQARAWLDRNGVGYRFHDFKKEPPDSALIEGWLQSHPWDALVNRRGTTWRAIPEARRPCEARQAIALMLHSPSVIKRPVLVVASHVELGFDPSRYLSLLS